MSNSLTLGKRVFAAAIAAVTILSTVGIAALAPLAANAQMDADPGDNIKGGTLSTVYYYGYDGSRYTYPNEKTYFTWFDGFNNVTTISDSDLADISLAGNVVYRPGSRWIKIQTVENTYAVSRDGVIHWIETEDVATDFDGSDWNTNIDDVPDVFFVDYTAGASLMSATAFDGMMYMDGSDHMLAWGGEARMVTSAGMSGNDMEEDFFLNGTGIDTSALTSGDDVTGHECDLQDAAQTGCVEAVGGQLTVSLASSSPASMSVPNSASGVEVATFRFTAGDAVTLDSLAVNMTGLAPASAIANNGVYLYEDGARLTDGKTVNSSTRKATFAGLGLDFANGQYRDITVVVDLSTAVNDGTFGFQIKTNDDVMTNGTVGGSFPVSSVNHSIIDLDVGTITISKTGSLTDPTLGAQGATIAKFNLEAGSAEDVWVQRLTLEIEDAKDHDNFQLYQGTNWIASGTYIGNDLVLFDLSADPYWLEDGTDRDFNVKADIGGDAGDNIKTHLDNDADLLAVGDDYGFGVTVTRTTYDEGSSSCAGSGSGNDCSFVTTEGGDVTLAFNGPPAGDVKAGAKDALFFEFSMTAERFIEVQNMEFDLVMTESDSGDDSTYEEDPLTDIRISDCNSGTLIAGPQELTSTANGDTTDTLAFTDNFSLDAGETLDLCATADVTDFSGTIEVNDTHTFTLDVSEFTIEDSAGDAVTDIIPSSDLAGNAQTVQQASLVTSLASAPSGDTTYVKGQTGVTTAGFNFTAGTASDVEMTDATVTVYVDEDTGGTFAAGLEGAVVARDRISSCSLYDAADDTMIAGPKSPDSTSGEMVFDSFSWWVMAGETNTAEVVCNLANVAAGTADEFAFEIDTATDITALDDDGDSVTPTGTANTSETVKISVVDNGTLDLSAGADVPDGMFLITGSTGNLVSSFRFDANSEAFRIDRLTVSEEQAEDDTGSTDSSAYANNVSKVRIAYQKEDGTSATAQGTMTGNERTFNLTSGNEIFVPKDDSTEVDVEVDVAATDRASGSATSNESVRMGLSVDTTNDDQFRARGVASNSTLNDDSSDSGSTAYSTVFPTVGDSMEVHRVRETAPVISINALSPSGSGFTSGDIEVLRFNVFANANEDVVLRNIMFSLSSSDAGSSNWNRCDGGTTGEITVSDFDLYKYTDLNTELDDDAEWTLLTSDATTCTADTDVVYWAQLAFSTDAEQRVIAKNTTTTYSLFFDTFGVSAANDDTIQVLVEGDLLVSTFLDSGADTSGADTQDPTDTTIALDGAGSVVLGDVICAAGVGDTSCDAGEEQMLVVNDGGATLTVVRGYNGTDVQAHLTNTDIVRLPGALLWQDDGSKAVSTAAEEYYGAHLVDFLPMNENNGIEF